jgi:ABC-type sulfate/molybdate transport systems ATPase subunit
LRWLKRIHETDQDVTILVTHDDANFDAVTKSGIVGAGLATSIR